MKYEQIPHYWINHVGFQLRKELERRFIAAGYKVSSEEWALLLISHRYGPISPSDLAQKTLRDSTTVSRHIDKLEHRGLLVRTRSERDRRVVFVELTPAGQVLYQSLAALVAALIEESLRGISKAQINQVVTTLERLSTNLATLKGTRDDL